MIVSQSSTLPPAPVSLEMGGKSPQVLMADALSYGDELIARIVDEAKRVLAEVGMEIRGAEMRRRLLEHGLPLDHAGERVLFPREFVERGPQLLVVGGERLEAADGRTFETIDPATGETIQVAGVTLTDVHDVIEVVDTQRAAPPHPLCCLPHALRHARVVDAGRQPVQPRATPRRDAGVRRRRPDAEDLRGGPPGDRADRPLP